MRFLAGFQLILHEESIEQRIVVQRRVSQGLSVEYVREGIGPAGRRQVAGNRRKRIQGAGRLDLGVANPSRAEAGFQSVGVVIVAEGIGDFGRGLVVDQSHAGRPSEVRHAKNRDTWAGTATRKPVVGLPSIADLAAQFVNRAWRDGGNDLDSSHVRSVNKAVALRGQVLPSNGGSVVVGRIVGMVHVPNRDPVARVHDPIGLWPYRNRRS